MMLTHQRVWLFLLTLALVVATASPAGARDETYNLPILPQQTFSGELTPAAPVSAHTLTIDGDGAVIWVSSTSLNLDPVLTSPSGQQFRIGDAPSAGVESAVDPDPATPGILGTNYGFALEGAEEGDWQIEVSQPGGVTAPVELFFTVVFATPRGAALLGTGEVYPVGSSVNLGFVLTDGTSLVTGLSPTGKIFKVGDPSYPDTDVTFDDPDGDGIYTLAFAAGASGMYQINARADVDQAGVRYSRTTAGRFEVITPNGSFDGGFNERGIDQNGNGLLDGIGVAPSVTVLTGGDYAVTVLLTGASGEELQVTAEATLAPGNHNPEVVFESEALTSRLGDGPYDVSVARLELVATGGTFLQDEAFDLGATAPYSGFEREAILLVGGPNATGVDFDANGLFDRFDVQIELDLLASGFYQVSAALTDPNGTEVGFVAGSISLASGHHLVTLPFAGEPIGVNGVDGPYELRSFIMYGAGQSTIVNLVGATEYFTASQFEGYVQQDTTPPDLMVTVDPESHWPPNHKMIPISVEILVVDDFDMDPEVELVSITSNEGDNERGDGNTSDDIQIDPTTGAISLRAERSGNGDGRVYELTYSATDDAGNVSFDTATFSIAHDQGDAPATTSTRMIAVASAARGLSANSWNVRWATGGLGDISQVLVRLVTDEGETFSMTPIGKSRDRAGHIVTAARATSENTEIEVVAYRGDEVVATVRLPLPRAQEEIALEPELPAGFGLQVQAQDVRNQYQIQFSLPAAGDVRILLYDVRGALVGTLQDGWAEAGIHELAWDGRHPSGSSLSSGVYFVQMRHEQGAVAKKLTVIN